MMNVIMFFLTTKAIKKKLKHDKIQTGTGNPDA